MNRKILTLLFAIGLLTSISHAQKEVTISDLLHNTYEVGDLFVYNHGCICTTCKEADFVCVKLEDSPFSSIAEWLKLNKTTIVEFRIYTEIRGGAQSNLKYTEQKAKALSEILKELGVAINQFTCKGMGASARTLTMDLTGKKSGYVFKTGTTLNDDFLNNILTSVGYEESEDGHRLNRRIEMKIIVK